MWRQRSRGGNGCGEPGARTGRCSFVCPAPAHATIRGIGHTHTHRRLPIRYIDLCFLFEELVRLGARPMRTTKRELCSLSAQLPALFLRIAVSSIVHLLSPCNATATFFSDNFQRLPARAARHALSCAQRSAQPTSHSDCQATSHSSARYVLGSESVLNARARARVIPQATLPPRLLIHRETLSNTIWPVLWPRKIVHTCIQHLRAHRELERPARASRTIPPRMNMNGWTLLPPQHAHASQNLNVHDSMHDVTQTQPTAAQRLHTFRVC